MALMLLMNVIRVVSARLSSLLSKVFVCIAHPNRLERISILTGKLIWQFLLNLYSIQLKCKALSYDSETKTTGPCQACDQVAPLFHPNGTGLCVMDQTLHLVPWQAPSECDGKSRDRTIFILPGRATQGGSFHPCYVRKLHENDLSRNLNAVECPLDTLRGGRYRQGFRRKDQRT